MYAHIVSGLGENRKQKSGVVQDKKAKLQSFISYANKNDLYVDPTTTDRLYDFYENGCQNSGNVTAHKTNSVAETRRNNGTIEDLMKYRGYAWVQGSVVPGCNEAGEGYIPPEMGEDMGLLQVKDEEEMHVT